MTKQVYLVISSVWTSDNVLNSFTVDDEVFEDSGEARQKASLKIFEFFGDQRPLSWDINENKNNFVQFDNVNIKTRTGEICKYNWTFAKRENRLKWG